MKDMNLMPSALENENLDTNNQPVCDDPESDVRRYEVQTLTDNRQRFCRSSCSS